jgi:DNA-binding NtrC family response regulator
MAAMKDRIAVRLLIVDDDEALCRKLYGWLEAVGYDVVTFDDPGAARRHATKAAFQLALVDLRLPDADGADVIGTLLAASPQMRVIGMCAFPEASQIVAAFRAGMRDLVEKPVQQGVLLPALERQLTESGIAARTQEEFNRRLGTRLRAMRRDAGRTLSDLAGASGITTAQLSQIELGKTATSTWTLARVCAAMRLTLGQLFEGM